MGTGHDSDAGRPPAEAAMETVRDDGRLRVSLRGDWTFARVRPRLPLFARELSRLAARPGTTWDLDGIARLDDTAAALLLGAWGGKVPDDAHLRPEHAARIHALATVRPPSPEPARPGDFLVRLGRAGLAFLGHGVDLVALSGRLLLDLLHLVRHPSRIPWREISANVHRTGGQALQITGLIGFLVGLVLSYLSALLLRQYGADMYIINVVGIGMVRELGPLLAAVLVAGRSGSSMTAQLGVMRVTQELDALAVMGISHTLRLVLPKVVALSITLPLIVAWTDAVGIVAGALVSEEQLNIGAGQFLRALPESVPVVNLAIGLGKAVGFGALIALVACHFGLRIEPNTESLGVHTTASVVTAITLVIVLDAWVAVVFKDVGFT